MVAGGGASVVYRFVYLYKGRDKDSYSLSFYKKNNSYRSCLSYFSNYDICESVF